MPLSVLHTSVFADGPGGGNPCPVVLDADSLTAGQMRSMAAGWNHETAFVSGLDTTANRLRLRFFVPNHEMEMCGHGTIGSVVALVHRGLLNPGKVRVETELGPIAVSWERRSETPHVVVDQFKPVFHDENPAADAVTRALGVSTDEIATDLGPICSVSTSRHKLIVPLSSPATLAELDPDFPALWDLCDEYETTGFYPFARSDEDGIDVEARQFPNDAGYDEDPATGVAACALAAYLARYNVLGSSGKAGRTVRIAQGHAMNRPSLLNARADIRDGEIVETQVAGSAAIEGEEIVEVP